MTAALVERLQRQRDSQNAIKGLAGREYVDSGLVFANDFGEPLHFDLITARHLKPLLGAAAVRLANVTLPALPSATPSELYRMALTAQQAIENDAI